MLSTMRERPLKEEEPKYPRLMRYIGDTLTVLFESEGFGTIIHPGAGYPLGMHREDWNMLTFTSFHGSVTLTEF